jgi:RNA polymerase sigma-70 factor (ECF subfamily)
MSDLGRILDDFRAYLHLLARLQLSAHLAGKIDLSGVVQQTLFEAYQARDHFPSGTARQAAWLRRALANNLTDEIRRLGPRGEQETPGRAALQREQLAQLAEALPRLPDDQRRAVELHHLQGLSLADAGQRLGCSREAVAGLVFRGLRKLRTLLSEKDNGAKDG